MSPKAEGGLWNSRGRSPREFHKPPEGEGHLITNFQNIMVLGPVHMIPLTGTSRLPMISPPIYLPIKYCIVFI
jgi:hypothetical protein